MSFDRHQHIEPTRANYEEAFLLYVDGELSPEAMEAVEAFAALHPDLREELDTLLETKLDDSPVSFGDTSTLMAAHMQTAHFEEDLLNYIDGELASPARAALEARLANDAGLRLQHAALVSAKLDPADTLVCPDKESLYRREERRRPFIWWAAAASVILLLGGSALFWNGAPDDAGNNSLADGGKGSHAAGSKLSTGVQPAATPNDGAVAAIAGQQNTNNTRITTDGPSTQRTVGTPANTVAVQTRKKAVTPQEEAPAQQQEIIVAHAPNPLDRVQPGDAADALDAVSAVPRNHVIAQDVPAASPSQNIGSVNVTNNPTLAYHTQNTALPMEATTAVLREDKPQSSFRGFLRKATRFVEKRTGIKATNENDQLVVGAVAINLK